MSDVVILQRFRVKRDTAAAFTAANTLLLEGEFGLETDTRKMKIGDGATAWSSLGYIDASFWPYSNGTSGLTAVDVQAALDEVAGYGVDDLSDVDADTPANGDVLIYEAASGTWKPGAQSGGGGGAMTLIGTATVAGAPATSITLAGLDLASAGSYLLQFSLSNATASTAQLRLFYNADTAPANYGYQQLYGDGSAAGASRGAEAYIGALSPSQPTTGNANVSADANGRPRAISVTNRGAVGALIITHMAHIWNNTANVTSITLASSVANALAVGSYFKVFKVG